MLRLRIPISREDKFGYNNINRKIFVPAKHSAELAEFLGIMLGDGHITRTQIMVTLEKDLDYAYYVKKLMRELFRAKPKIFVSQKGYYTVYFGSCAISKSKWLLKQGMAYNKDRRQIKIPGWVFQEKNYLQAMIRGLVDTDGSIHRLKWGGQISFCNASKPLLYGFRKALLILGFNPSKISGRNVYLTRKPDILRYIKSIGFKKIKTSNTFKKLVGGSYSGNYIAL